MKKEKKPFPFIAILSFRPTDFFTEDELDDLPSLEDIIFIDKIKEDQFKKA
jgi:hypothetical protein